MFREKRIETADGLSLAIRLYGEDPAETRRPPVVCLPGLTRNGRDFHRFAQRLLADAGGRLSIVTIDSRGRGNSDRDPDPSRYTVPVEAEDVRHVLRTLGVRQADFVGTSRGGLVLHMLATVPASSVQSLPSAGIVEGATATATARFGMATPSDTPASLLRRVVLNDIGPVIETGGLRQIQAYLDPDQPRLLRAQAIAGLKTVHGPSFPAWDEADWEDMADAIYRNDAEGLIADYDPAIARMTRALDLSRPLPDLWALFSGFAGHELMVVRGENSSLLSEETVSAMRDRHPGLHVVRAPGEGHAPALHRDPAYTAIRDFLLGGTDAG